MAVILLKHLLSVPDSEREQRSIRSISQLGKAGIRYEQEINPPFPSELPPAYCTRPSELSSFAGARRLGPGHYGCYLAHRRAIEKTNWHGIDALLIVECDAVLNCSPKKFRYLLSEALSAARDFNLGYLSFGPHPPTQPMGERLGSYFARAQVQFWTHCYLIFPNWSSEVIRAFEQGPWDTIDMWYNQNIREVPRAISTKPWCLQSSGYSLVDGCYKDKDVPRGIGGRLLQYLRKL